MRVAIFAKDGELDVPSRIGQDTRSDVYIGRIGEATCGRGWDLIIVIRPPRWEMGQGEHESMVMWINESLRTRVNPNGKLVEEVFPT